MKVPDAANHFPWQRLAVSLIGSALVWYFLRENRAWTWNYFESMMQIENPSEALANVAAASIASNTTITNVAITAVSGIVFFFITGNVMALSSMFKFSSAATSAASVASETVGSFSKSENIDAEFQSPGLKERYGDK